MPCMQEYERSRRIEALRAADAERKCEQRKRMKAQVVLTVDPPRVLSFFEDER